MSAKKRKPYEGAGRQPLVARGVSPERLYARVTPDQMAALDVHAERLGLGRAEAVRVWLDGLREGQTKATARKQAASRRSAPRCCCYHSCGEDSHSGDWHQHEDDPCPAHPEAPMVG